MSPDFCKHVMSNFSRGLLKAYDRAAFEVYAYDTGMFYDKIIVCELNSGHFVNYLRAKEPDFKYEQLNKVQGQPFMVQEIVDAVKAL